ncbi:MAG: trypsin-like peptidase domain-containing protein [Actinomycetota bacterium]|nr:trypsin-like peptidase domain-containing protein [Actinomycetota bacterium]
MSKQFTAIVAALLLGAGVGGGVGAAVALETDSDSGAQDAATANEPVAETTSSTAALYNRVKDAVVEVHTSTASQSTPFGDQPQGEGTGSGFVIDEEGHIVTNQHVVDGAESVRVEFSDGTDVEAEVVGTDPSTDIAVLDVDRPSSELTPLSFASTGSLDVGDWVAVLGSPFGLEGTLTTGVISAVGREIRSPNGFTIENAVQTDASLNHGNSGGPVIDTQGRVVGVAAQIRSDSGGSDGVGYAVPGDTAKRVAEALIEDGSFEHAYLGVSLEDDGEAKLMNVVNGSPAATAKLRANDVVVAVDGNPIETGDQLREAIDAKKPGDSIELKVRRGDDEQTVKVKLTARPDTAQ